MADSVRMVDLASMTRGLHEFRRLDPEARVLSHRLATQAAVHRVEEQHRGVAASDQAREGRLGGHPEQQEKRHGSAGGERDLPNDEEPEAVPEREQGRLLDLKA